MADVSLPKVLTVKSWTDSAAGDDKTVAKALKDLGALYDKFEPALLDTRKLTELDDMENRADDIDAMLNGVVKSIVGEIRTVLTHVKALEAKLKKEAKPDKARLAAVQATTKAGQDFALALPSEVAKALAELNKRADKQKAEDAKKAAKDEDPELKNAGLQWINDRVLRAARMLPVAKPEAKPTLFYFAEAPKDADCLLWMGPQAGAGHRKKLLDLMPKGVKPRFFKGLVVFENKALTFVAKPVPTFRKLKCALHGQTKKKYGLRVRSPDGGPAEEEAGDDILQDTMDAAPVAAGKAPSTANPQKEFNELRDAKSKTFVQALGLAKAMPTAAMSDAAAKLKKKIEDAMNLAKTSAGVDKAMATLKEADAIAQMMIKTSGGTGGAAGAAKPAAAAGIAADLAERIRRSSQEWTTVCAQAEKGIDDVVAALKKMFEGDAAQRAAVDGAVKRLLVLKAKVRDEALTRHLNEAARKDDQRERGRLIAEAVKAAQIVQKRIADDPLMDDLDGARNDVLPGLNIISPMKAALEKIRALA
jgi:hypothetical protein